MSTSTFTPESTTDTSAPGLYRFNVDSTKR